MLALRRGQVSTFNFWDEGQPFVGGVDSNSTNPTSILIDTVFAIRGPAATVVPIGIDGVSAGRLLVGRTVSCQRHLQKAGLKA